MQAQTTSTDKLPHLTYQNEHLKLDDPSLLRNQVSSTNGQITIIGAYGCSLVLDYSFGAMSLTVGIALQTPVGSVTLINGTLGPNKPTLTAGGSVGSFKAEATVSFDFGTKILSASGEICAPFVGCKSGGTQVHV